MRATLLPVLSLGSLFVSAHLLAQAPPATLPPVAVQRDSQATAILQQSVQAMGAIPSDSEAYGTLQTTAGGQTANGTIRILTKGLAETFVQMTTSESARATVYCNGRANESVGTSVSILSLEQTVTAQAPEFPLPLIAGLIQNADESFQLIGLESSNNQTLYHIRVWNSFASQPSLQSVSSFSTRDVWIDTSTNLPQHVSYVSRAAQGAVPGITVDIYYMTYQNFSGVLYPSSVQESINSTPWASISIENVTFNTGLTDANFPIQ